MSLREEIKEFTDADGLVSPVKTFEGQRNASGNGLLYTSLYYLTLFKRGELTLDDIKRFIDIMKSCQGERIGTYTRGPIHSDRNTSFDDYIAVLACSRYLSSKISNEILNHGKSTAGYYNASPDPKFIFKQWLWRSPSFAAHCYFATGQKPLWLFKTGWKVSILLALRKKKEDQDAWILTWLLCEAARGVDPVCDEYIEIWYKKLHEVFGNAARGICERILFYPDHPLGKYFVL